MAWQALDYPAQRGELLRQLFTDVALEVDPRAQGRTGHLKFKVCHSAMLKS
jgi:hypothetical protein